MLGAISSIINFVSIFWIRKRFLCGEIDDLAETQSSMKSNFNEFQEQFIFELYSGQCKLHTKSTKFKFSSLIIQIFQKILLRTIISIRFAMTSKLKLIIEWISWSTSKSSFKSHHFPRSWKPALIIRLFNFPTVEFSGGILPTESEKSHETADNPKNKYNKGVEGGSVPSRVSGWGREDKQFHRTAEV